MLVQGNRYLTLVVFLTSMSSCDSEFEKKQEYFEAQYSTVKNFNQVEMVLASCQDTINHWIELDLKYYHNLKRYDIEIDKRVFFNSILDKCVLNLLVRNTENRYQDMIIVILGEFYEGSWWFYSGPTYVISRERHTANAEIPLSFEKLSEISRINTYGWYYVEKETGTCLSELFDSGYTKYSECLNEKYLINDSFFETELNVGMSADSEKRIEWYLNKFLNNRYDKN